LLEKSKVVLVECQPGSRVSGLVAATFGLHDYAQTEKLAEFLKCDVSNLPAGAGTADFVRVCRKFHSHSSWLDLGSHLLDRNIRHGHMFPPPTVVLVDSEVRDLALYWSLRTTYEYRSPGKIIPFPAKAIGDTAAMQELAKWLATCAAGTRGCWIAYSDAARKLGDTLIRRLGPRARRLGIRKVKAMPLGRRIPCVIPYSHEETRRASMSGKVLSFGCPRPVFHELMPPRTQWVVDLVSATPVRRAPGEVLLPPRPPTRDVLNCPFPPTFTWHAVPRIVHGDNAVGICCTKKDDVARVCLPSDTEVLEAILEHAGARLKTDEKRQAYNRAIEILGGMQTAARAFSGDALRILAALRAGNATFPDIMKNARLGNGKVKTGVRQPSLLEHEPSSTRRLLLARLREAREESLSETEHVSLLLERWRRKGVVHTVWRCAGCNYVNWPGAPEPNAERLYRCRKCSELNTGKVTTRHLLDRKITNAMKEGIVPVVLTSRFLRNLTSRAFQWLPGVKGLINGRAFDFDVCALCDGILVVAECKTLSAARPGRATWQKVGDQLRRLAEAGVKCGAQLIVLAAMTRQFPKSIERIGKELAKRGSRLLLLDRPALEEGYRYIAGRQGQRRMTRLDDVL